MKNRIPHISICFALLTAACAPQQASRQAQTPSPAVSQSEKKPAPPGPVTPAPSGPSERLDASCSSEAPIVARLRIESLLGPGPIVDIAILSGGHYRAVQSGTTELAQGCLNEKDRADFERHAVAASFQGTSLQEVCPDCLRCQAMPNRKFRLNNMSSTVEWADMCGDISPDAGSAALAEWMTGFSKRIAI